jgi:hypothetical protein
MKRYVYRPSHPKASPNGFVAIEDLGWEQAPERLAKDAPIMAGRFYENTAATDGTDIGSRRKHREYMKARGLTTMDDYRGTWKQAAKEREKEFSPEWDQKQRREDVARAWYERNKP